MFPFPNENWCFLHFQALLKKAKVDVFSSAGLDHPSDWALALKILKVKHIFSDVCDTQMERLEREYGVKLAVNSANPKCRLIRPLFLVTVLLLTSVEPNLPSRLP